MQWGQPQSIVEGARRWFENVLKIWKKFLFRKISMEAEKILNETTETFKGQEALISTTDIFMFAPENFTRDILDKLKPVKDNWFFKFLRKIKLSKLVSFELFKCCLDL